MRLEDCYYLGTITRTHGLKGGVLVKLDTDEASLYETMESVLLDINGALIPFFLKNAKLHNKNLLRVEFDIPQEEVQSIVGVDLYLPLNSLPELDGNKFYYHEIIDFLLKDENGEELGVIKEVNDQLAQSFFVLISNETEKELYIPIINDWILEVNRTEKYISMDLPLGIANL